MRAANDNGPRVVQDRHIPAARGALSVYMSRERYALAARRTRPRYGRG